MRIKVTILGEGEFDGLAILEALRSYGWHYLLRSAKDAYPLL